MSGFLRSCRFVPVALITIGLSAAARADTETHRRVTIRGTGSDISVERTETLTTPEKKPELARAASASPVLSEAIRMKESGGSDAALLAYLRSNASRLPVVVDLETVDRLRRAGTGKPVLAYLASVAAIEIGDSGAAWGPPEAETPAAPEYEPVPAAGIRLCDRRRLFGPGRTGSLRLASFSPTDRRAPRSDGNAAGPLVRAASSGSDGATLRFRPPLKTDSLSR